MLARTLTVTAAALLAFLGGAQAAPTPNAASPARPNVIVILADDLGYADTSLYPGGRIKTPNLERLGKQGVVFEQGYVASPVCSPSRAALMTGRYSQRFGFEHNTPRRGDRGLDPAEPTIGSVMQAAGYRTGAIGKWHLGFGDAHYPTRRGFETFWGFLTGQTNYIDPASPLVVNATESQATQGEGNLIAPARKMTPLNRIITGDTRQEVDVGDRYLTDVLTDQAIDFIGKSDPRPFLLYLAHPAPHSPLQAKASDYAKFPQIKDRNARVYAAMVTSLDDNVGRLLDHLERTGKSRNTLVIFLSDNGCAAYIPGICSTKPLSGSKLTQLEGGTRVPFVMRWPARIPAGGRHATPVSSLDILPTAAAAGGAQVPADHASDGRDLVAQLTGPQTTRALYWRNTPVAAVREGQWKYYRDYDGGEHLYDLRRDPREMRDLAAANPAELARLRGMFASWQSDKMDPKWITEPTEFTFGGRTFKFRP